MLTPQLEAQDGDCHARDGSCARCDRGYLPVDSSGVVKAQHGWSNDNDDDGEHDDDGHRDDLRGAYTCCLPQSVRLNPHVHHPYPPCHASEILPHGMTKSSDHAMERMSRWSAPSSYIQQSRELSDCI